MATKAAIRPRKYVAPREALQFLDEVNEAFAAYETACARLAYSIGPELERHLRVGRNVIRRIPEIPED